MSTTISRLYNSYGDARAAVQQLELAGVADNDISIIASNADNWYNNGKDTFPDRDLNGKDDRAEATARATARTLVVHHRRAGGQSQHSAMLELDAKSDRVQTALAFARKNLREPLTVEQLAEAARLSPRQFSRVFRAETGQSPAQAIENLRLEAARFMLEQGRLPVGEIARETGFGDRERMRRSFRRTFGQTPQAIRNASRPLATF
jgi:transcriptional regulator GlxA family with amidase domain